MPPFNKPLNPLSNEHLVQLFQIQKMDPYRQPSPRLVQLFKTQQASHTLLPPLLPCTALSNLTTLFNPLSQFSPHLVQLFQIQQASHSLLPLLSTPYLVELFQIPGTCLQQLTPSERHRAQARDEVILVCIPVNCEHSEHLALVRVSTKT